MTCITDWEDLDDEDTSVDIGCGCDEIDCADDGGCGCDD